LANKSSWSDSLGRQNHDISFNKEIANHRQNTAYAALEHPLIKGLLRKVKSPNFGGLAAKVEDSKTQEFWATAVLRWQNEQGKRLRREFIAITRDKQGGWDINPDKLSQWLLDKVDEGSDNFVIKTNPDDVSKAYAHAETRLANISTAHLHPESIQEVGILVTGLGHPLKVGTA
jgi:hypothetical protein